MRFFENGYYVEKYLKCVNCGLLVGDIRRTTVEQVAGEITLTRNGVRSRKAEIASTDRCRQGRGRDRFRNDARVLGGRRRSERNRCDSSNCEKFENRATHFDSPFE